MYHVTLSVPDASDSGLHVMPEVPRADEFVTLPTGTYTVASVTWEQVPRPGHPHQVHWQPLVLLSPFP